MVEMAPTRGTQLVIPELKVDSVATNTTESTCGDSVVNSQLSHRQHQILMNYLTRKDTAQRKYGSGWLSASKSAGTARTENQYLKYWYRVHWRKKPIQVYIGSTKDKKILAIAKDVRLALDQGKPPHEIEAMIERQKQSRQ